MNRDVNVIINATAGTGWPPQRVEALRSKFSAVGLQAEIELIHGGDDLLATVRRVVQSGASTVVAGGGDGTVSTVASCLVESGIVLGVLPMGTLNHFAKDLRIPLGLDEAVATHRDRRGACRRRGRSQPPHLHQQFQPGFVS